MIDDALRQKEKKSQDGEAQKKKKDEKRSPQKEIVFKAVGYQPQTMRVLADS